MTIFVVQEFLILIKSGRGQYKLSFGTSNTDIRWLFHEKKNWNPLSSLQVTTSLGLHLLATLVNGVCLLISKLYQRMSSENGWCWRIMSLLLSTNYVMMNLYDIFFNLCMFPDFVFFLQWNFYVKSQLGLFRIHLSFLFLLCNYLGSLKTRLTRLSVPSGSF